MTKRVSVLVFLMLLFSAGGVFAQKGILNVGSGQTYTTIQAAVNAANNGDVINIVDALHIEVGIIINKNITIQGQGADVTTLQGEYVSPDNPGGRMFYINSGHSVTIQDLKIYKSGASKGTDASVAGNTGGGGESGGAIYNEGTLIIKRCLFHYNIAGYGGNGLAGDDAPVASAGQDGQDGQSGGSGGDGGNGGAIANTGSLLIYESLFTSNYAGGAGDGAEGGIGGTGGTGTDNTSGYGQTGGNGGDGGDAGSPGSGGAIVNINSGYIYIVNSTFGFNKTGYLGLAADGGIGGYGGYGNNSSPGIYGWGGLGGNGGTGGSGSAGGRGGAISVEDGSIKVVNCTFSGNSTWFRDNLQAGAGGRGGNGGGSLNGYGGDGGNGGTGGAGAVSGIGGALYVHPSGNFEIINTIVADNDIEFSISLGGEAGALGPFGNGGLGGGGNGEPGTSGVDGFAMTGADCYGTYNSLGYNIIYNQASSYGWVGNDLSAGTNPNLQPLAFNGGTTQTMKILDASPANNAATTSQGGTVIPSTDQRGMARQVSNGGYDIGAYEYFEVPENIVINEVDVDQSGVDNNEFIEIYDGGVGNTSLSGLVIVLYNGANDLSYDVIDLTGKSTDANGYFVIGSSTVPNVDMIEFTSYNLQNGSDAVALYNATVDDFPNGTSVTSTNLIDALVYDTNDSDDAGLLVLLNSSEPQVNEGQNGSSSTHSMQRVLNGSGGQRNTSTYVAQAPTPGMENTPPAGPTISVSETILGFGDVITGNSIIKSYVLIGENLTNNISVGTPVSYQVSTSYGGPYSNSLNVSQSGGSVNQTIYVKFISEGTGEWQGNVTNSSSGATTQNVGVGAFGSSVTVSENLLDFGEIEVGDERILTYDVNTTYTKVGIEIEAPSGYTVSVTEGSGYANSIHLTADAGTIDLTTIFVKFEPIDDIIYNDNLLNVTNSGTSVDIELSGRGFYEPTLTVSDNSLDFGEIRVGNNWTKAYYLDGIYLTNNVTVTAPTGFLVKKGVGGTYVSSFVVTPVDGVVDETVYVKFSPTEAIDYNGNITNVSTGVSTKNVAVTGTGYEATVTISETELDFGNVYVGDEVVLSYTVEGEYLEDDITVTGATPDFLVSTDNSTFTNSVDLMSADGRVYPTIIYVKFSPTATAVYNDFVSNECTGADLKYVDVTGTGVEASLTTSVSELDFGDILYGTTSSEMSFVITGSNLFDDVTIVDETILSDYGFEISTTSGSGFGTNLVITPDGNGDVNQTIYVRCIPNSTGNTTSDPEFETGSPANHNYGSFIIDFTYNGRTEITTDPTSIDFGNVNVGTESKLSYNVYCEHLYGTLGEQNFYVYPPSGDYTISNTENGTYGSILVFSGYGETIDETVWIKFSPSSTGVQSDNATHSNYYADTKNLPVAGTGVEPILSVSPTNLSFGNVEVGSSSEMSYVLTGEFLTANATVMAPTGYEVSLTSGSGFASSVNVTQNGGNISQTIYVKFSPVAESSYNGSISNESTDANTIYVTVSGTGVPEGTPTITSSLSSIDFGDVEVGISSELSYNLTAVNLTDNVSITAPAGYEVSLQSGSGYASSIDVVPSGGAINLTIYVKFSPVAETTYSGDITNESTDATTQNVAVTGNGVIAGTPITIISFTELDFGVVTIGEEQVLSYTISGANLTENIEISLETGSQFTISDDNTTFGTSLSLVQAGGTVAETTIYVKFAPLTKTDYSDIIFNESTDATTREIALFGSSATGIDKIENIEISVYPNPSTGLFNIESSSANNSDVYIYDVSGKLIYRTSMTCFGSTQIDFTNKANGLYFIKIQTNNEIIMKKIVIQ